MEVIKLANDQMGQQAELTSVREALEQSWP